MIKLRPVGRSAFVAALAIAVAWAGYFVLQNSTHKSRAILHLADGTIASLGADTRLVTAAKFPAPREVSLDGEALLKVPAARAPLMVRTRLMRLEVLGSSTLQITANSRESGEEVEVLDGEVIVSKNYRSSYRVPDDLHAGEMSMVNESIDLMEKERVDAASLEEIRVRASGLK